MKMDKKSETGQDWFVMDMLKWKELNFKKPFLILQDYKPLEYFWHL
jgi:hypothetical protein